MTTVLLQLPHNIYTSLLCFRRHASIHMACCTLIKKKKKKKAELYVHIASIAIASVISGCPSKDTESCL